MAVKMNTLQQVVIGFFILLMLPLCVHLGIQTFLGKEPFRQMNWELEQKYRAKFYKQNNIDPKSLQGAKSDKEVQVRWQAAEIDWNASKEKTEFEVENLTLNKDAITYSLIKSIIFYSLALLSIVLAYLITLPIIAASYLLTVAYFVEVAFRSSLQAHTNAWISLLMYSLLLVMLLWMAMRKKDVCQN